MHWFQKCNFWKHSLTPFRGRWGHWGQTTSKSKMTKILNENLLKLGKIQNLESVHSSEKDELCPGFEVKILTKSVHRGEGCSTTSWELLAMVMLISWKQMSFWIIPNKACYLLKRFLLLVGTECLTFFYWQSFQLLYEWIISAVQQWNQLKCFL